MPNPIVSYSISGIYHVPLFTSYFVNKENQLTVETGKNVKSTQLSASYVVYNGIAVTKQIFSSYFVFTKTSVSTQISGIYTVVEQPKYVSTQISGIYSIIQSNVIKFLEARIEPEAVVVTVKTSSEPLSGINILISGITDDSYYLRHIQNAGSTSFNKVMFNQNYLYTIYAWNVENDKKYINFKFLEPYNLENGIIDNNSLNINAISFTESGLYMELNPGYFSLNNEIYYLYKDIGELTFTGTKKEFFIDTIDIFAPIIVSKNQNSSYSDLSNVVKVYSNNTMRNKYNLSGIKPYTESEDTKYNYTYNLNNNEYMYNISGICTSGVYLHVYTGVNDTYYVYYEKNINPNDFAYFESNNISSPLKLDKQFISITNEEYHRGRRYEIIEETNENDKYYQYLHIKDRDGFPLTDIGNMKIGIYKNGVSLNDKTAFVELLNNSTVFKITYNINDNTYGNDYILNKDDIVDLVFRFDKYGYSLTRKEQLKWE